LLTKTDPWFSRVGLDGRQDTYYTDKKKQAKMPAKGYEYKNSPMREWMKKTGCTTRQYALAYKRAHNHKYFGHPTEGFTLEQEIARAMETADGKIVNGKTRKRNGPAIQDDGNVPVLKVRRKRILAPAPDALAVPLPFDGCWTESPEDYLWLDEQD